MSVDLLQALSPAPTRTPPAGPPNQPSGDGAKFADLVDNEGTDAATDSLGPIGRQLEGSRDTDGKLTLLNPEDATSFFFAGAEGEASGTTNGIGEIDAFLRQAFAADADADAAALTTTAATTTDAEAAFSLASGALTADGADIASTDDLLTRAAGTARTPGKTLTTPLAALQAASASVQPAADADAAKATIDLPGVAQAGAKVQPAATASPGTQAPSTDGVDPAILLRREDTVDGRKADAANQIFGGRALLKAADEALGSQAVKTSAAAGGTSTSLGNGKVDFVQVVAGAGQDADNVVALFAEGRSAVIGDTTAIARAAASAPATVRPEAFQQVADAIRIQTTDSKLTIRLDPPELGRVGIELSFDNNRLVTALLSAESGDTAQLLRRSADSLQRELAAAGFEGVNVNIADAQSEQAQADIPDWDDLPVLADTTPLEFVAAPAQRVNIITADRIDARF